MNRLKIAPKRSDIKLISKELIGHETGANGRQIPIYRTVHESDWEVDSQSEALKMLRISRPWHDHPERPKPRLDSVYRA